MATKTWIGTDGSWSTAGNWSPSGVPADADTVFITSGSDDIDGDNQSAIELARLVVGPKFTGKIGTSGTKMQIDADVLDFSGAGDTYLDGFYTTTTVQDTGTSATALNLSGATIATLRIVGGKGNVNIASTITLSTTIEMIGANGVTLNIADSTTIGGSATLTMDDGKVELGQAVPTITIYGGELEATLDTGTVTELTSYGGRVRWKPTLDCTITTLTLYGGTFDSRDATTATYTITNCTIHEGATLDERSGTRAAVYSNAISMQGGEVRLDAGRGLALS